MYDYKTAFFFNVSKTFLSNKADTAINTPLPTDTFWVTLMITNALIIDSFVVKMFYLPLICHYFCFQVIKFLNSKL